MLRTNQAEISSTYQALNNQPNLFTELNAKFRTFLKEYSLRGKRIYHERVQEHIILRRPFLSVELLHLKAFDESVYEALREEPQEWISKFEQVLNEYVNTLEGGPAGWQLQVTSEENVLRIRELHAGFSNKLVVVNGIVVKATKPYLRGTRIALQCSRCQYRINLPCPVGDGVEIPRLCVNGKRDFEPCGLDSLKVVGADSHVENFQKIVLEEYPEDIPRGETPRSCEMVVERRNACLLNPGERVNVTGIMLLRDRDRGIRSSFIWGLGLHRHREVQEASYSPEEEEQFKHFAKDPAIYTKIFTQIAPKIYGSQDIKQAITCQLFGGSRKTLPDGTRLRGDINVLLVGDPSTAKSQFLIFAQKLASISVYASGKGSSAAGLTASINKDPITGEFQIEAGALVRADGGLVCIDEFDKMRPEDRVAIHEAMEQQTISIAKAGITSRLNTRCSILAAANPVHGRYDNFKQITEQINLMSTILSRFDCIFVVRDAKDAEFDADVVSHVLDLHINRGDSKKAKPDDHMEFLRKYISYCRHKCSPRLTSDASEQLKRYFVEDRKESAEHRKHSRQSIPITVRQLEAIIRLSESLAKMQLSEQVLVEHVNEAHRLFQASTLSSLKLNEIRPPRELTPQIQEVEMLIKRRVPVDSSIALKRLLEEFGQQFTDQVINHAIRNLVACNDLQETDQGRKLRRRI